MPTISELPVGTSVNPADEVLVSQAGTTRSVSIGTLLASTQPAIMAPTGSLLGRVSAGAGGPDSITVGTGLALITSSLLANGTDHASFPPQTTLQTTDQAVLNSNGTPMLLELSMLRGLFSAGANVTIDGSGVISAASGSTSTASGNAGSIAALSQVEALAATDLVAVSHGGTDCAITYANFLDGETIDEFAAAAPAVDTDTFPVGQGTSTMLAQTFGAVWTWIAGHLPGYKLPVVEITVSTTLDGSAHNGRILVCSQPVTLTHSGTEGSGFACRAINVSSGTVTLDSGVTTTSGVNSLASGQAADIVCFTYSGGTTTFAWISGPLTSPTPGVPTGLTNGTVTSFSIVVTWSAPTTGGAATGYVVQYRQTLVGGAFLQLSTSLTTATLTGLSAGTKYDIDVYATNSAGNGNPTSILNVTTNSAPSVAPGQVTGLLASGATVSTMSLSWSAPTTGGAVATYTVQYRQTSVGGPFSVLAANITSLSTTVSGLSASTSYDFEVYAVNSAGNGTASSPVTASTTIAAPGTPTGLTAGSVTQTTAAMSWIAPSSGGAVTSYTAQYRITNSGNSWTQVTGITGTGTTLSPLTASTEYDVQVQAVGAGGNSSFTATVNTTTYPTIPGTPTSLTTGTATSTTMPLTWTQGSGGAPATYAVQYSLHGANSWTLASSSITGTSYTVTGLTANTSYDFEVRATNTGGSSSWTAATTASTMAPSNYQITLGAPFQPLPSAGWATTASYAPNYGPTVNVYDNSNNGYTAPASVNFAWSSQNTTPPTTGLVAGTSFYSYYWAAYPATPTAAGSYYLWCIFYNSSGTIVASAASPVTFTVT